MNLLQLQRGRKSYGTRILFDDATFSINAGEHIGVIGPNGAGKTTLFKILLGLEEIDEGEIIKSHSLRCGYLEQESDWSLDMTPETYLSENCTKPLWQLQELGVQLGLTEKSFTEPMRSLSGGYRMRVQLLYLIGQEPNLMLLDEPTNFLDLESLLALEKFLQGFEGAFLMISHDREFLRRTTDATLEIEGMEISKFPGNIDDYFEQKEQIRLVTEAQATNQEIKRQHLQSFIDRFGAKATKAKQAQSRMKSLEKMEKIEVKKLPVRAKIAIPPPLPTGKETLSVIGADLGYGDLKILSNVNLRMERGTRLGVVGYNGAGKSTLLKALAGRLPLQSGELKFGYQVKSSYFAQHVSEDLHPEDTVLTALRSAAHNEVKDQEVLNIAGSLLFSGEAIKKKIKVLSGGEKSRVALGQILLQKSPFLILDEPTNHLDFDTVESMTEALSQYEGSLIVVSHDRGFIGRVASKILEIRDGEAHIYPGSYDEYVWSLEKGMLAAMGAGRAGAGKATGKQASSVPLQERDNRQMPSELRTELRSNHKAETKRLNSEIRDLEKQISRNETHLKRKEKLRAELTEKLITATGGDAQNLSIELAYCSKEIEELENELMTEMESKELKEKELQGLKL